MSAPAPVQGRCDLADRLVEADVTLAALHQRCGGDPAGVLAVPALLTLVRQTRVAGVAQMRRIRAVDDGKPITFLAEATPDPHGTRIALTQWRLAGDTLGELDTADAVLNQIAAVHGLLDSEQRVLAVDLREAAGDDPALAALADRWRAARQPWHAAVDLIGVATHHPLHWRMLDDVAFRLAGSPTVWRARLLPRSDAGFDLLVLPDAAAPMIAITAPAPALASDSRLIGRDLAPALRQPVRRIMASAEIIRTRLIGPLADDYAMYAADIAEAARHLLALVEDMADLDAVESPDFMPARDAIDCADCARRAAAMLTIRAAERDITLVVPPMPSPVPAIGEARRVMQILLNLVTNAIRYSPAQSTITMTCGSDGAHAWIAVADQGPGLSDEQAISVFNKFERLGRSGDGGAGLGLYIARRLARAMRGDLVVAGRGPNLASDAGARFVLTLPARLPLR